MVFSAEKSHAFPPARAGAEIESKSPENVADIEQIEGVAELRCEAVEQGQHKIAVRVECAADVEVIVLRTAEISPPISSVSEAPPPKTRSPSYKHGRGRISRPQIAFKINTVPVPVNGPAPLTAPKNTLLLPALRADLGAVVDHVRQRMSVVAATARRDPRAGRVRDVRRANPPCRH